MIPLIKKYSVAILKRKKRNVKSIILQLVAHEWISSPTCVYNPSTHYLRGSEIHK